MSKLTLDALKERASEIATEELLEQISGGTENACHDSDIIIIKPDNTRVGTGSDSTG